MRNRREFLSDVKEQKKDIEVVVVTDTYACPKDALGDEFKHVFVTNNNYCGIYLLDMWKDMFILRERWYEEKAPLYVYDTCFNRISVR